MKRRELLAVGAVALVLPAVRTRAYANVSAHDSGMILYDSRYPQSVAIAIDIGVPGQRLDLRDADPVRLWRERLLPVLHSGATVAGCCTYSTWYVLQSSALEARHRAQLVPQAVRQASVVTLVAWQLLPRQQRPPQSG
jgi:hypothetical protein